MWPLGHAAVAYLCYRGWQRLRATEPPGHLVVVALLFGSQFPDLVDKPLAWYLGVLPTGRTLAHSLLVLVPLSLLVYAVARRLGAEYEPYAVAFTVGALSHALVDAMPVLWGGNDANHLLWPLIPVESYEDGAPTILELFMSSLSDPYFVSEFVLAALALVLWRADGYPGLQVVPMALEWGRARLGV